MDDRTNQNSLPLDPKIENEIRQTVLHGTPASGTTISGTTVEKSLTYAIEPRLMTRPTTTLEVLDAMANLRDWELTTEIKDNQSYAVYKTPDKDGIILEITQPDSEIDRGVMSIVSKLMACAKEHKQQPDGSYKIEFNTFMDFLGYKKEANRAYNQRPKLEIWRKILKGLQVQFTYNWTKIIKYNQRRRPENTFNQLITRKSPISDIKAGYYNGKELIRGIDMEDKVPDIILVTFSEQLVMEMLPLQLGEGRHTSLNVVIQSPLSPDELRDKFMEIIYDYISLKHKDNPLAIRVFETKELVKRAGNPIPGRPDMNRKRLMDILDKLRLSGLITKWGFRSSYRGMNRPNTKPQQKNPYVWIDFSGTPAYQKVSPKGYKRT